MGSQPKAKILIIEDDLHIAAGIELNLQLQGYRTFCASDGPDGLKRWREVRPDLIVLDIMLPGIDGLSILQSIRLEDERVPILILSAKATSEDIVKGLAYGVDDYLSKPFNLEEFLLRVDRLLTRAAWSRPDRPGPGPARQVFNFGPNSIDFETGTAQCRQGAITLTDQEIKLLKLFIANRGKPLSRGKLLEVGWGYSRRLTSRTVDNFVVRLRKYFEEDPKNPQYFKSVRSVGYLFETPEPS
ncbi:MAG: response regulator transcription factor [Desulfobacterales bacterium]